jgi:hypothetical protein
MKIFQNFDLAHLRLQYEKRLEELEKEKEIFVSNVLHFIWEIRFGLAPCHYCIIHNTILLSIIVFFPWTFPF